MKTGPDVNGKRPGGQNRHNWDKWLRESRYDNRIRNERSDGQNG